MRWSCSEREIDLTSRATSPSRRPAPAPSPSRPQILRGRRETLAVRAAARRAPRAAGGREGVDGSLHRRSTSPIDRRTNRSPRPVQATSAGSRTRARRSEEHTSELQSHSDLVCRLLLEKKKKK